MKDIVFEQNYAKKVEHMNQMAFDQGIHQGRQMGWNEVFSIVMQLQAEKQEITQDSVTQKINEMLMFQQTQQQ